MTGLILFILLTVLVTLSWTFIEVDVNGKGIIYKAAKWIQLVATLNNLFSTYITQSLQLAILEHYAEEYTAWVLLMVFACALFTTLWKAIAGHQIGSGKDLHQKGSQLLAIRTQEESVASGQQSAMEEGESTQIIGSGEQKDFKTAIRFIDIGRWILGNRVAEIEMDVFGTEAVDPQEP